jgi:thioredoxin reductase (NADPH)
VAQVAAAGNLQVHWNSEVSEVLGTEGVEGARVGGEVIPCSGFFAFVGLQPASGFLPAEITRDAQGAVLVSADLESAMPGVFAAGIVRAGCGGTLQDAIADGQAAARAVIARLRPMT